MCDIDETLVSPTNWNYPKKKQSFVNIDGIRFYIHKRHVTLLKEFKARGFTIILWSAGGSEWAKTIAIQLKLEPIVDFIMDKPNWYIDDKPSTKFMGEQIFLDPMNFKKDIR